MGSTVAAVAIIVVLTAWHLRTRRHRNWHTSADARFYVSSGYPLVAIAVYFLVSSSNGTDWEWALGNFWAFVAMVCFVLGFNALNAPTPTRRPARPTSGHPTAPPPIQRRSARDITTR